MKKTKFTQRLLSMALCLSMVLSLVLGILPGLEISAYAADNLLPSEYKTQHFSTTSFGVMSISGEDDWTRAHVWIEDGTNNDSQASRIFLRCVVDNDYALSDWFVGKFENAEGYYWDDNKETNVDLSQQTVRINNVESIKMTGGNLSTLQLECTGHTYKHPLTGTTVGHLNDVNFEMEGGKLGTLRSDTVVGAINYNIRNAEIGTIYSYGHAGAFDLSEVNLRVTDSTVGDIWACCKIRQIKKHIS